jgi:hypothetical protein
MCRVMNHHCKIHSFLHMCSGKVTQLAIMLSVQQYGTQNSWMKRLVEPSPYDRRPADLTTARHKGHVRSLSNLLFTTVNPTMRNHTKLSALWREHAFSNTQALRSQLNKDHARRMNPSTLPSMSIKITLKSMEQKKPWISGRVCKLAECS